MDYETRGLISATINEAFERQNVLETVDWILEADSNIGSREDLALGYLMGALMNIAVETLRKWKVSAVVGKRFVRWAGGKKKARVILEAQRKRQEETRAKGGRPTKPIETTKEEEQEIREMLIPMIAQFREKIRKEEALRRV